MGRYNCSLRSPKEEQQVPDSVIGNSSSRKKDINPTKCDDAFDVLDEFEGILGIKDEEKFLGDSMYGDFEWNFMEWDEFPIEEERRLIEDNDEDDEKEEEEHMVKNTIESLKEGSQYNGVIKMEDVGIWDEEERSISSNLNLNLNYQEVMDAWSDRGSLWANDYSLSMANNTFMGEVPVLEEERRRREASVLRYKEKRQSRLFSKKIRYQVRKLNADKRPRLKGRFVKRVPDKIR